MPGTQRAHAGVRTQENGNKNGNGNGATPKKHTKGVSFADDHLILTGDSLNSHTSIPEDTPGNEDLPPGDANTSADVPVRSVGLTCIT